MSSRGAIEGEGIIQSVFLTKLCLSICLFIYFILFTHSFCLFFGQFICFPILFQQPGLRSPARFLKSSLTLLINTELKNYDAVFIENKSPESRVCQLQVKFSIIAWSHIQLLLIHLTLRISNIFFTKLVCGELNKVTNC